MHFSFVRLIFNITSVLQKVEKCIQKADLGTEKKEGKGENKTTGGIYIYVYSFSGVVTSEGNDGDEGLIMVFMSVVSKFFMPSAPLDASYSGS